jgi:indolepyruvate ferredoxin oxidoreductase, beta subunit
MTTRNFLVAGVGGQGTLLASDILAEVGMRAGYDAKKSDVLGLAIRGGSVLSHVRWGDTVFSPVIRAGEIDYLLAFEPLEALRGVPLLRRTSVVVCNNQEVMPISVSSGNATYPSRETIRRTLASASRTAHFLDATQEAVRVGNARVANVILLGAFSALLDVSPEIWEAVVLERVPERHRDINRTAFHVGRELVREGEPA